MRKSSLYYAAGAIVMLVVGIYSCKKVNGIDNNMVVQTPYSLYFADTAGGIYNTNNGKDINPTVLRADGRPTRALCISADNLLYAKGDLYISSNNGENFNHSYDSLGWIGGTSCSPLDSINTNQSMILDIPAWSRLYTLSNTPAAGSTNYFGLAFNDANGIRGHWHNDGTYDTVGDMGFVFIKATSMTMTVNGILHVLAVHTDGLHVRNLWAVNQSGWVRWHERTGNPDALIGLGGLDQSGHPLPPTGTQTPGYFTLGHLNNRLIAIDHKCLYGAYYSDDTGKNWTQFTGLPANTPLMCVESPFEEIALIGTAGKGLYVYNTHTESWESNNRGLGSNLVVRSIVGKKNIYKNGTEQKYIYLATDQGIYQSTDGGLNWTKTIPGNFVSVY